MATDRLVSIGLPVYNGGAFLELAIRSLLSQTHRRFELIISDNASTDGTAEVCRRFCEEDSRVVYSPLNSNIGGVANHSRVQEMARGDYFMWASSDDLWEPSYVERCLKVLDERQDVVLVYSINARIDEAGQPLENSRQGPPLESDSMVERFALLTDIDRPIEPFYGLMRLDALRKTALMTKHPGFDRIMLAEMGLLGKMVRLPEPLYCRRVHGNQSIYAFPSLRSRYRWINPEAKARKVWPHLAYVYHFGTAAVRSAPRGGDKARCLVHLLRWCNWHRSEIWGDLVGAE
jgi:glycosyltransferase involved in cell wall biosynthesis